MFLTQPKLWPFCLLRAKFAGASCSQAGSSRPGAAEPRQPGQAALCALSSDGLCGQYRTTAEQRLSKLGVKSAQGDKPAMPEPLLTVPSRAGTHSHQPGILRALCCALPLRSQGQVFGTAFTRVPPGLCLEFDHIAHTPGQNPPPGLPFTGSPIAQESRMSGNQISGGLVGSNSLLIQADDVGICPDT
ncbi:hypothetical protein Nmel_012990 [Mimus melanotis]